MSRADKRKGSGMAKVLIIVLVVLLVLGVAGKFLIYDKIKEKAVNKVSEKVIEQMLENTGSVATREKVEEILNNISDVDRAKVEEIVGNQFGISDVPKITEYINNSDVNGLKEYAKKKLSNDQISELYGIYQKYN